MRIAYFDGFSGASGDMILGALLSAGGDERALRAALDSLPIAGEFELIVRKTNRGGVYGTDAIVRLTGGERAPREEDEAYLDERRDLIHSHGYENTQPHPGPVDYANADIHTYGLEHLGRVEDPSGEPPARAARNLRDIQALIDGMEASDGAKALAGRIFSRIAGAEAAVHGIPVDRVHFHELGAADSIVDILGSAVLIDALGADRFVVSPLTVGSGTVKCDHGVLPVPSPATAKLLADARAPFSSGPYAGELLTPTGAAILTEIADGYGALPPIRAAAVGYGYGKRETGGLNALRVLIGEAGGEAAREADEAALLESNLDAITGEELGYLIEKLFDAGALDAWAEPIYMKKGRPAYKACALCEPNGARAVTEAFFKHGGTLGVRRTDVLRTKLPRAVVRAETRYGAIRVKKAENGLRPEYDDAKAAAEFADAPLRDVYGAAIRACEAEAAESGGE